MANKIKFEYTWCDYLTPCPHGRDCFVGDFDCSICSHFAEIVPLLPMEKEKIGDYKKYSKIFKGEIICKKTKIYD